MWLVGSEDMEFADVAAGNGVKAVQNDLLICHHLFFFLNLVCLVSIVNLVD